MAPGFKGAVTSLRIIFLLWYFHIHGAQASASGCTHERFVLTNKTGSISVGNGLKQDYNNFARCEWLIKGGVGKSIQLEFRRIDTECSYDYVFVYDGNSYNSTKLASVSGDTIPEPLVAKSGYMLVLMFSDRNYQKRGFKANYSITDCPFNCYDRGVCTNNSCVCDIDYTGESCEHELCPNNCSGNGVCVQSGNSSQRGCLCSPGYAGYACDLGLQGDEHKLKWVTLLPSVRKFSDRFEHSAAFIKSNECVYVFGGNSQNGVLDDLQKYCFSESRWEVINKTEPWPSARYDHSLVVYEEGMFVFGGVLSDGSHSNELWLYDTVSANWSLLASNSTLKPPGLSGHSMTLVDDVIYIIGGKTDDGKYSSQIYSINASTPHSWNTEKLSGGRTANRLLHGHSAVYHPETSSIIIYGGIAARSARYTTLSNKIFTFNVVNKYWTEIHYNNYVGPGTPHVPRQRAHHTALIMGNYMVIYGGNVHIHNTVEMCYDEGIYLYHLGCHQFVNHSLVHQGQSYKMMPRKGRFGHTAVNVHGNIMVIIGGYSGYPHGDILAYKFPGVVAPPDSEVSLDKDYCMVDYADMPYSCYNDLECIICKNRTDIKKTGCVHRTRPEMCQNGDLAATKFHCHGVCSLLKTCQSCLSQGQGVKLTSSSPRRRFYQDECSWCVKNSTCQRKAVPEGSCQRAEGTVSGIMGWWNGVSPSWTDLDQCSIADIPSGIQKATYYHPRNDSQPDEVEFLGEISAVLTTSYPNSNLLDSSQDDVYLSVDFHGYIWPLEVPPVQGMTKLILYISSQNAEATISLSNDSSIQNAEIVKKLKLSPQPQVQDTTRKNKQPIFPSTARDAKYYFEVEAKKLYKSQKNATVAVKWNAGIGTGTDIIHIYTEFLEMFHSGSCGNYTNCLSCMTDASCGWCPSSDQCIRKGSNSSWCGPSQDALLVTHPMECSRCPDYVDCLSCSQDALCEWKRGKEQCHRRGRVDSGTVTDPSMCRMPCHQKKNCSTCIAEQNECFWCESTQTCFPFSHYSSHFIHGKCQDWVDFDGKQTHSCLDCAARPNCTSCLERFGCGWCGDSDNPKIGKCVAGGFPGPSEGLCGSIVSSHANITNQTFSGQTNWTYDDCLDVNECRLGLHKCHEKAECINTKGPEDSYECLCEKGYIGNGTHCELTCFHDCVNGTCSGDPNYECVCDLGWTGPDCSVNCGCNFHSTCKAGVGKCDKCQAFTDGQFCQHCRFGYYGNPTEGCHKCSCNDHGDISKGICNNVTGECYCTGNTQGLVCQHCSPGHYGSPENGGKCYRACKGRTVLEQAKGSLGLQLPRPSSQNKNVHCLWIISSPNTGASFTVTVDGISTLCRKNHVMVFDGVPTFISGNTTESRLLGTFCGFEKKYNESFQTNTGTLTVYYEMDLDDSSGDQRGFNLSYAVNQCKSCKDGELCVGNVCQPDPNHYNAKQHYQVCPAGCDTKSHGTCVCLSDLDVIIFPWNFLKPVSKEKSGSVPGRYGHSVTSCGENSDSFYIFGGYSQEHGALNDIWTYNPSTYVWTQVVPITSDHPDGRFFHQAVCSPVYKEIYVYGGVVKTNTGAYVTTNEFWKFSIGPRMWTKLNVPEDFRPIAGHTMTLVKERHLVVIGGISSHRYFSSDVYIYNTMYEDNKPAWSRNSRGSLPLGLYGHSAVYDPNKDVIYIHGGMVFKQSKFDVSRDTYVYDMEKKQAYFVHVRSTEQDVPRVFHTAVQALGGMLVIGGMGNKGQITDHMSLFRFKCSVWQKYEQHTDSGTKSKTVFREMTNSLIAASSIHLKDRVYIVGGYNGTTFSQVVTIKPQETICQTATRDTHCRSMQGCDFCVNSGIGICNERTTPDSSCSGAEICNEAWYNKTDCSAYRSCRTCLAVNPYFNTQPCKWCMDCESCIRAEEQCNHHKDCEEKSAIRSSSHCLQEKCEVSQCPDCLSDQGCTWANCIHQGENNIQIVDTSFSSTWRCAKDVLGSVCTNHSVCPKKCEEYTDCELCQRASGTGAGSRGCVWSSVKQQCFDEALLPLHCVSGECGIILQREPHKCPEPCSRFQICAECIKAPWCGWCAFAGYGGEGICMRGGRDNPTGAGSCLENDIRQSEGYRPINLWAKKSKGAPTWAYSSCPPENECVNTHHDCDNESQDCTDTETSYNCTCKTGYLEEPTSGKCKPHCHHKCMNGTCIRPDICHCNFGYVGKQCEKECQCYGNSNCPNDLNLRLCLKCMNHTKGDQCESCESRYVGDPTKRKSCVSCFIHCNNHTLSCVSMTQYSNKTFMTQFWRNSSILNDPKLNGSKPSEAICVGCQNNTMGKRCDQCKEGYFRVKKEHKTLTDVCIKCQCNGHSDTCKNETGEGCQCLNNTETPACTSNTDPNADKCWQKQCSKCKEYFIGEPTKGHHCYRQMTVDKEYCFDPDTQTNCNQNPGSLLRGRTVFFAVQPRYLNVDIRITIDVTHGAADVYFSSSERTFTVNVQKASGIHMVDLDSDFSTPRVSLQPQGRSRRSVFNSTSNTSHPHLTLQATNFHTYYTVQERGAIIKFQNVRSRLVMTLPLDQHDLRTSKFYVIVYGQGDGRGRGTFGNLYFRQDQPHIDLFVFFSVFFSCFFLFLAICVLLWKFKQAIDTQRSRQRQQKEMLHMASRPFAKVLVLIEPESCIYSSTPVPRRRTKYTKLSSRNPHHLPSLTPVESNLPPLAVHKPMFLKEALSPFDIVPIATEPTADNMAALRTVVIQLPGDQSAPSKLCLGTGLTSQSSRTNNSSHQKSASRQAAGRQRNMYQNY